MRWAIPHCTPCSAQGETVRYWKNEFQPHTEPWNSVEPFSVYVRAAWCAVRHGRSFSTKASCAHGHPGRGTRITASASTLLREGVVTLAKMMAAKRRIAKRKNQIASMTAEDFNVIEEQDGLPTELEEEQKRIEEEKEKKKIKAWFWGLLKYAIFVSVFTTVNVGFRPSLELFEFSEMWKQIITGSLNEQMFIGDVWPFLNGPVLTVLAPDFYVQTNQYWSGDPNQYVYGNRLLGSVRLRQIRVSSDKCPVLQKEFLLQEPTIQDNCFPSYSSSKDEGLAELSQDVTDVGFTRAKDRAPLSELPCEQQGCVDATYNNSVCCADMPWFRYRSRQDLGESSIAFWATYHRYPGGGYVADLTSETQAKETLEILRNQQGWLDLKTRALFVDFTFYNPNVDLFVVARVVFEFLPSGLVVPFTSFRVLRLISYSFDDVTTLSRVVLESILGCFILIYSFDECQQLHAAFRAYRWKPWPALKSHFGDMWNTLDFTILMALFIVTWLKVENTVQVAEILQNVSGIDPSALQNLGFWATQEANMSGVLALILWIKVFRYITITRRLERLFQSIWRAVPDLLTYALIFGVWIFSFSVSGIVIFGNDLNEFVDMQWSMTYCMRIIFGDFDYVRIYWANRILGPIWLFAFMWSAVIILLNFFVAILCEVYAEVMDEDSDDDHRSILEAIADQAMKVVGWKKELDHIVNVEAHLDQMDTDGDGKVTKVELNEFLAREGAFELFDATEAAEVVKKFDKNDNGYLDMEEMRELKMVLQKRREELQGRIEKSKQAEEKSSGGSFKQGTGAAHIQAELRGIKEQMEFIQERAEKTAQTEKKMMAILEGLANKVNSLMEREQDFKFLRGASVGDWIK